MQNRLTNYDKGGLKKASRKIITIMNITGTVLQLPHKRETYLQTLVTSLQKCLSKLNSFATDENLETWAILIHECMSSQGRSFHSVEHAIGVGEGSDDPILVIAGLFHDTVYCNVDGGLSPKLEEILGSALLLNSTHKEEITLGNFTKEGEPLLSLVASVFGFSPGQKMTAFGGGNEFLSAYLAVLTLRDTLTLAHLSQIVACIEATIPFRKRDEDGNGAMERLYNRMRDVNINYNLEMTDDSLVKTVHSATELTNRDIGTGNFTGDHDSFLEKTWKLLPESNIPLRRNSLYNISDFQYALIGVEKFFRLLDPQVVFTRFRNQPNDESFSDMIQKTKRNLDFSRDYVRAKLMGISIIAALAQLSGGDCPISLFMGDLPSATHQTVQLEDVLPKLEVMPDVDLDEEVFDMLANGRKESVEEHGFDRLCSPVAAYIYALVGRKGVDFVLNEVTHPMDDAHSRKVINCLPVMAVMVLTQRCAKIAVTRARKLRELYDEYESLKSDPICETCSYLSARSGSSCEHF